MSLASAILAQWRFDKITGVTVDDDSGVHGLIAVDLDNPPTSAAGFTGFATKSVNQNDWSGKGYLGKTSADMRSAFASQVTIALWCKVAEDGRVIGIYDPIGAVYGVEIELDTGVIGTDWIFYALAIDYENSEVYSWMNGTKSTESFTYTALDDNYIDIHFGGATGGFGGSIAAAQIRSGIITDAQAWSLYQAGPPEEPNVWSYSGNPSDSDLDKVRFLCGDTDAASQLLKDEEIENILDSEPNTILAAASACDAISTILAKREGSVSRRTGSFSSTISGVYSSRAKDLRKKAARSANWFFGGQSKDVKSDLRSDSDAVQPHFEVGQDDNYEISESLKRTWCDE